MDAYTRPAVIPNKREFEAASYLLKSSHSLEEELMSENFDEFVEGLQKKIEKPGLLKRFLDWIARGADKSSMGKASCPT
jgi:hypothetical protein